MTTTSEPDPLPPLRKGCTLHESVMRAIRRGHANSWAEAYGVGMYLANPKTRAAGMAWMEFYGVPRSRFCALLMLREESGDPGDIGV